MASATLPDFQWSRFYYPQILEGLIAFKSTAWPEHTETDPHDPVIQLLRLFALVGHQQAVRLDHVARELYLPTLRLRSSMIGLASLVDYTLALAVPATADVLADLNRGASIGTTLIRAHTIFSTEGTAESPPIQFEHTADNDLALSIDTGVWGFGSATNDLAIPGLGLNTIADHSGAELAADLWGAGGAFPPADDALLLWWHTEVMFDRIAIVVDNPQSLNTAATRFEYYDDSRVLTPDTVVDAGGQVQLKVDTLVGTVTDSDGLEVVVTMLRTGQQETLRTFTAAGEQRVLASGTLGQTTISLNAADYSVRTFWPELPGLVDGTNGLAVSGDILWTLPQGDDRRWQRVELENLATTQSIGPAWFVRARVSDNGGGTAPTIDAATEPDGTTYTTMIVATQGRRITERVGTTDGGGPGQSFTLRRSPLLELISVTLSDGAWARVDTFLSSTQFDRHYTLIEQPDASQLLTFGDGTRGKLPPATSPVTVVYRIGGDQSGNVGPLSIVRDRTGNGKLVNVRNVRAASGWVEQEGTTDESLDLTRVRIPASLRAGDRAVTPADMEALAVAFRTTDEAQVAERALAIEEGAGPKTVELVTVAPGGQAPTQAQLDELDTYFNGADVGLQRVGGVMLANTTLVPVAFTPRAIAVTALVDVLSDFASGADQRIVAALESGLSPTALRLLLNDSGVWIESSEYQWRFGGTVGRSFLITRIATAIPGIVNVTLLIPTADVVLLGNELPVPGVISVTVTPVV